MNECKSEGSRHCKLLMVECCGQTYVVMESEECCAQEGDEVEFLPGVGLQIQRGAVVQHCWAAKDDDMVTWLEIMTEMVYGVRAVWRKVEVAADA